MLDPNDQAFRRKVGTMAGSLLCAANHKATNDLALWLYIYRDEGFNATSHALLILAILSNLPATRLNRSFAYNAANDYIGEASYDMLSRCIFSLSSLFVGICLAACDSALASPSECDQPGLLFAVLQQTSAVWNGCLRS